MSCDYGTIYHGVLYRSAYRASHIMGSHPIQRAADIGRPSMEDMRVDHRRCDIAMA